MSSYSSTGSYMESRARSMSTGHDSGANHHHNSPSAAPKRSVTNNSVVEAMITSNNLRNCAEVQDMILRCRSERENKSSVPFVCKTAHRYFAGSCVNKPPV